MLTLGRLLSHLDTETIEFFRDEFVIAGENVPGYPAEADLDAFDFADWCHDVIEIRTYGRIVTERTEP